MIVKNFFHKDTSTLSYVVHDETEKIGVVIDSAMDFDFSSGRTGWTYCEEIADYIDSHNLKIPYVLDTHAHADHLTGLEFFKKRYDSKTVIGKPITLVQETFGPLFNFKTPFISNGSQFDLLMEDQQILEVGPLQIKGIHTPGHTPACFTYQIEDALFVGDTLFMTDLGMGRCDFPGGSAETLYDSAQILYKLPNETRVFLGHDYMPGGRELCYQTTIGDEKKENIQLNGTTTKEEFVKFRTERDAKLSLPKLILPSLQINILGGRFPEAEDNGTHYIKLPLNAV